MGAIAKISKSRVPEGLAKKRSRFAKQAAKRQEAKAVAKKAALQKQKDIIGKARPRHPNPRFQPALAKAQEDPPASPTPTDRQRRLHPLEQGLHPNAPHL